MPYILGLEWIHESNGNFSDCSLDREARGEDAAQAGLITFRLCDWLLINFRNAGREVRWPRTALSVSLRLSSKTEGLERHRKSEVALLILQH